MFAIIAEFAWEFSPRAEQINDAYISYRYAYNLVAGRGLVFNVGEYVEGYTNLLWTLLVAAGMRLGASGPAAGHWLGLISSVAALLGTYVYAAMLLPQRCVGAALMAPAIMLASNAFVRWSTAGLETPLFVFFSVLAAILALRRAAWLVALACMLATMTRPEGVLLAAIFVGLPMCGAMLAAAAIGVDKQGRRGLRPSTPPGRARTHLLSEWVRALPGGVEGRSPRLPCFSDHRAVGPALAYGAFVAALTLFRLYYYGDPLPNTFYAKVGDIPPINGLIYIRNFLVDGPACLLPGALAAAILVPATRLALGYAAVTTAYIISIGGDVFQNGRFLLPVLPMLAGAAIAGASAVHASRRAAGMGLFVLLPACALCSLFLVWPPNWGHRDSDNDFVHARPGTLSAKRNGAKQHYVYAEDRDAYQIDYVARLRALPRAVHSIATVGVGRLGYYAEDVTIIDLVGLLDRHIARSTKTLPNTDIIPGHSRTDAAYVLARRPDIIQIPRKGTWGGPMLPALADLWSNPDLERLYVFTPPWNYVRR